MSAQGQRIADADSAPAALSAVRELSPVDYSRWDAFVQAHPEATFYHLSGWKEVIGGHLRHPTRYLYVERDGQMEGVLPLARVKSWLFGDALISLPFLVYGGPVSRSPEATGRLIEHAAALADEMGVDYLELRNRRPLTDWPRKERYVTFRKEIDPDPEVNLKAIPRKQRAMVRKGIKAGLEAEMDGSADRLYDVLSECKRNLGTPFFAGSYLQNVADTFGDDCEILTITRDGEPVASVMSFRFRDEILPYYGGGIASARDVAGNDFLYWKVMERAALQGIRIFDYGRSQKDTGPYRFKKHWGFEPEPLSYEYHLVKAQQVPQLDPSNKRYQQAIKAWARLPLPVARLIGPPLARRLG
ncbi:FemAB family XrtA/PEP-CTERM system-associated protein [Lentisalinibacter salinarum]|uniref:FemAB family XrtA/PEP-CTERM system-associated protein n=1 Tax=Lentisalinibacter salinarum TaxID=2992239 RepID=UPI00386C3140